MTRKVVIRLVELANGDQSPEDGLYLQEFDPHQNAGRGHVRCTPDKMLALRFDNVRRAVDCWRQQSRTHPLRWYDGEPNRPLTAFTISLETVEV